jgi:hypothetical protein
VLLSIKTEADTEGEWNLRVIITNPVGGEAEVEMGENKLVRHFSAFPGAPGGVMIVFHLGFNGSMFGTNWVNILLNEANVSRYPLTIVPLIPQQVEIQRH